MQLVFTKNLALTNHYLPNLLLQLAIGLPLILVSSAVFYLLLEKPFMKKTLPSFGGAWQTLRSHFSKNTVMLNSPVAEGKKLLTVALLLLSVTAFSQNPLTDAYKLPPLDTLIKIAKEKSPVLRSQDVWIEIQKQEWKLQKKAWTNLLLVGASTNVGTNNVLDFQQTTSSAEYISVNRQSAVYNVGLTLRVSLGDVVTRGDKNNIARLEWERAQTDRLILEDKIREEVIAQYDHLQAALRLLVLEAQSLETQRLAFEVADKYFKAGTLEAEQYSTVVAKMNSAQKELELGKIEAQKAYRQLREFVGI
jgi:outer membrane protein TolC